MVIGIIIITLLWFDETKSKWFYPLISSGFLVLKKDKKKNVVFQFKDLRILNIDAIMNFTTYQKN